MEFLDQLLSPFNSAMVLTKGLPNLKDDIIYTFNIQQTNLFLTTFKVEVWLPGEYVGRDQNGFPSSVEQYQLMIKHKAEEIYGQGGFRFVKKNNYDDFLLSILPFIIKIEILS